MRVKDLIEALKDMDGEMDVYVSPLISIEIFKKGRLKKVGNPKMNFLIEQVGEFSNLENELSGVYLGFDADELMLGEQGDIEDEEFVN